MNYKKKAQYSRIKKFAEEYGIDISHLYQSSQLIQSRLETAVHRGRCSDDQIRFIVEAQETPYACVKALGLKINASNKRWLLSQIQRLNLSVDHFDQDSWHPKQPLEDILVKNSPYQGGSSYLKKRLFSEGILRNECYECGLTTWRKKSISLQLDHINGDNSDNRIENLQILCPNCHSQTSTYCGRNKKSR